MRGLAGIRVLDLSSGIAGPYATKLLTDAGADVVTVEPAGGDPMRAWRAPREGPDGGSGVVRGSSGAGGSGAAGRSGAAGALWSFLHHGKRSIVGPIDDPAVDHLLSTADLVVDTAVPSRLQPAALRVRRPSLVVLSITPFGRAGPYAERPATDFTIQAESGGIAFRGHRAWPPYQAGGRIVEWVSGTFAAVAALACLRRATLTGIGETIDMSMLELANQASTTFSDLTWSLLGRPPLEGLPPARMIETPSIEPTADGFVGFCTNSRQQFDDFLLLIERPDLLGDEKLARHQGRAARFDEWSAIVRAWTSGHTTGEIIRRASDLRLPVAPVCNGATVGQQEHFRQRGIFRADPTGTFRMPRRPWQLGFSEPPEARPAPLLGEHNGQGWLEPAVTSPAAAAAGGGPPLPLEGVRIVDLTAWWAGPAATHMLAGLGADVIHIESIRRPDGMRMTGGLVGPKDAWWEYSSIFLAANANKRGLTIDLTSPAGLDVAKRLIAVSDAVVENFTPRVMDHFGLDWETVQEINPRAILLRMPAFGLSGPWRDNTGFAQTMEQMTGLAWVTGFEDDQPRIQRGPCDPNAGLQAAFALLVALAERDATGAGQHVEAPMIEASLNVAAEQVIEHSGYGNLLQRHGNRSPHAAPQNLYRCQGTEQWLALSVTTDEQWQGLCTALSRHDWLNDRSLSTHAGRWAAHERLDGQLANWAAEEELAAAVDLLISHGVPAGTAVDPRATAFHPQLQFRRYVESIEHPVVGTHWVPGLPFRFDSVDHWLRRPAPTMGQDNHEILRDLLGLSAAEIEKLEETSVIGTRPIDG